LVDWFIRLFVYSKFVIPIEPMNIEQGMSIKEVDSDLHPMPLLGKQLSIDQYLSF